LLPDYAAQHEVAVRLGLRRDVHGVDVGGPDDGLGIVVPAGNPTLPGEFLSARRVAIGDGDEPRMRGPVEAGAAFHPRDLAAADPAPAKGFKAMRLPGMRAYGGDLGPRPR